MEEKYELTTLRDIFEKVPLHKIEVCLKEITALMVECKTVEAAMKGLAHATTGDSDNAECIWPEPLTWIDDGEGDITAKIIVNGEYVSTIQTKV